MNCYLHPDLPAAAYCRSCGRGLCVSCERPAEGTVFCPDHLPAPSYAGVPPRPDVGPNPYYQPAPQVVAAHASPGLAFLLGLIPGVGAIYNGQYLKGFIHVAILGVLISIISASDGNAAPFWGLLIAAWYLYMPFEAYHTAKKRQAGIVVDEWSSLLPGSFAPSGVRRPVGPMILIAIGVLFLLDNLRIIRIGDLLRFWPLILIVVGVSALYSRLSGPAAIPPPPPPGGPVPPSPHVEAPNGR